MTLRTEKVKIFIHRDKASGGICFYTGDVSDSCSWLALVGETEAEITFDESELSSLEDSEAEKLEKRLQKIRDDERELVKKLEELRGEV